MNEELGNTNTTPLKDEMRVCFQTVSLFLYAVAELIRIDNYSKEKSGAMGINYRVRIESSLQSKKKGLRLYTVSVCGGLYSINLLAKGGGLSACHNPEQWQRSAAECKK